METLNYWFAFLAVCAALIFREASKVKRENNKPVARLLRRLYDAFASRKDKKGADAGKRGGGV